MHIIWYRRKTANWFLSLIDWPTYELTDSYWFQTQWGTLSLIIIDKLYTWAHGFGRTIVVLATVAIYDTCPEAHASPNGVAQARWAKEWAKRIELYCSSLCFCLSGVLPAILPLAGGPTHIPVQLLLQSKCWRCTSIQMLRCTVCLHLFLVFSCAVFPHSLPSWPFFRFLALSFLVALQWLFT